MIEKYGRANSVIAVLCCSVFLLNSVLITKSALLNINDSPIAAFALNFLVGCEGILGKWGCMSYATFFEKLQLWRAVTTIYLHGGVIHLAMNLAALLTIGKYAEKRLGTALYAALFHFIAIADAIAVTPFFRESDSVGASRGIFGVIGIALVLYLKKQIKPEKKEIIFLIVFFLLSLGLGTESFVLHISSLILGIICGAVLTHKKG